MTYAEAKKAVSGKLIFGDAAQIAAIHWLREFNQLKHAVMNCQRQHKTAPPFTDEEFDDRMLVGDHCACLNSLDSMTDERAEEMHNELRKYLQRRNARY